MADLNWIGAIGSGLFSGVGNYMAARESREAQREANLANMYLAKYQNDRNLELWNMQNEYNAPKQQMARLKEAGLNPNLVYGNGSAVNVANAPASTQVPHIGAYTNYAPYASGMASSIGSVFDNLMKIASIKKTNQETSNLNEYQNNMKLQASNLRLDNALKRMSVSKTRIERQYWAETAKLELQQRQQNLDISGEQMRNLTQDTISKTMHNEVYEKYGSDQAEADLLNSYSNLAVNEARMQLMSAQVAQAFSQVGLNNKLIDKASHDIDLVDSVRRLNDENATLSQKKQAREDVETEIKRILKDEGYNIDHNRFDRLLYRMHYLGKHPEEIDYIGK